MPDASASPELPSQKEKSWVWHATLESRDAGKVSVLACFETVFAVVLYWWIAIKWDTHWHLISSVLIAPLLLLRSQKSMELGAQWFLSDWFGFKDYEDWSVLKRKIWTAVVCVFSIIGSYLAAFWSKGFWFSDLTGWQMFGAAVVMGAASIAVSVAVSGALVALVAGGGSLDVAIVGVAGSFGGVLATLQLGTWTAVAGVVLGVILVAFFGAAALLIVLAVTSIGGGSGSGGKTGAFAFTAKFTEVGVVASLLSLPGIGIGVALRALLVRLAATTTCLGKGFQQLPQNWCDNNFHIDSSLSAELLPGIREHHLSFTSDGLFSVILQRNHSISRLFVAPALALFFFLPALVYRINIKATCWFWWPLAFFLKPFPSTDLVGQQKQAMCWPWEDPWQKLLILVPALVVIPILIFDHSDPAAWQQFYDPAAVPIPLKIALGMEWNHIPPWHWALLIVEVTGIWMLVLAGNACSHKRNDNWGDYAQTGLKRDFVVMNLLTRVRSLAAIAFMLFGLGMCFISFPNWRQHMPEALLHRLESFYGIQEPRIDVPRPQLEKPGEDDMRDEKQSRPPPVAKPLILLVDSPPRRGALDEVQKRLAPEVWDVIPRPASVDWLAQCEGLAKEKPAALVIHWQTFRNDFPREKDSVQRDWRAEERLLRGLRELVAKSPKTKIILFSRSFSEQAERKKAMDAVLIRVGKLNPEWSAEYKALVSRFLYLPWSDTPDDTEIEKLRKLLDDALKKP